MPTATPIAPAVRTPDATSTQISHLFDAPRARVWRACTDPALLPHWWRPGGVTTEVVEMDVRVGGRWRYQQRNAKGEVYAVYGEYLELDPPARAVLTFELEGMPDHVITDSVTFEEQGEKTLMTVTSRFATQAERDDMLELGIQEGAAESYARLAELLARLPAAPAPAPAPAPVPELTLTRTFDLPRARVWRALTEAEALARWFGPVGTVLHIGSFDLRPGGHFHYANEAANGVRLWGIFHYREVVAPERLLFTSAFADEAGAVVRAPFSESWPLRILNLWTLHEEDGRTTLTLRGWLEDASEAERAAFAAALPMVERGMAGTLDQLAAWLAV